MQEKKEVQYVEMSATLNLTPQTSIALEDNTTQPKKINHNVNLGNVAPAGLLGLLNLKKDTKFDNMDEM